MTHGTPPKKIPLLRFYAVGDQALTVTTLGKALVRLDDATHKELLSLV